MRAAATVFLQTPCLEASASLERIEKLSAPERIAIIGVGHVGSTTAFALMLRGLFREIVLVDTNVDLAEAEAADLMDANALTRPARIWAGTYADAGAAGIAVI